MPRCYASPMREGGETARNRARGASWTAWKPPEAKQGRNFRPCPRLLAQAESADDGLVTAAILVAEIVQQAGSLADHLQQTAPASMVLLVRSHMLVKLIDTSREQRDLHFRRAGVVL